MCVYVNACVCVCVYISDDTPFTVCCSCLCATSKCTTFDFYQALIIGPSSASLSHTSHPSLLCTLSCPHNSFICPTFMWQHPDKVWDQPLLCALLNMGHTLVYSGNEPSRNWWTNFCLMALYSYWGCALWTKMT